MRAYSKMTDEEFIKAYETPYTKEEEMEFHKSAMQQYKDHTLHDFTDEVIDEIFEID